MGSAKARPHGVSSFLTGQAHALFQSRLHGNTMEVDAKQRELLETYAEVVNVLLRTYATD